MSNQRSQDIKYKHTRQIILDLLSGLELVELENLELAKLQIDLAVERIEKLYGAPNGRPKKGLKRKMRPPNYKSVEDLIHKYLSYNGLTIQRYVDGRYYRVTQKEVAKELADKLEQYLPCYPAHKQDREVIE